MKQTNKIFLLVVLMCLTSVSVMADKYSYDFEVEGIRYAKINETKVKVVPKGQYRGDIVIPKMTTYNGNNYMVTTIGEEAFDNAGLTSISLPESITTIETGAFRSSGLTSITLPESVTTIGRIAFWCCKQLQTINIPEGVTTLEPQTFYHCTSLLSIHIPDGVKTIDRLCFEGCESLKTVTGLKGVTSIEEKAFLDCENLTEISIPSKLETLGEAAFSGCTSLSSPIVLPSTLASVKSKAFYGCNNIPSVTFSEGVEEIGSHAFSGCSLLTSIFIPASISKIGTQAFEYCTNLATIKVAEDNPIYDSRDNCNAIMRSVNGNYWLANTLTVGCNGTVIPSSTERIGGVNEGLAFVGCTLPSIYIPAKVKYIENSGVYDYGFKDCYIGEIVVDDGNKNFDSRNNCNAVINSQTNVLLIVSSKTIIPKNIVEITGDFRPYTEMTTLYTYASTPPTLYTNNRFTTEQFQNMDIYVPKGSKAKYESATGWDNFWNIKEFDATGIGDIKAEKENANVYFDLRGNRLDAPKHGVNIINGKKVIVK